MATAADYRCQDHGTLIEDAVFDGIPPGMLMSKACEIPGDKPDDEPQDCVFKRVWSPVAIGAVAGAGGSPART